jgi:hypothetical protein
MAFTQDEQAYIFGLKSLGISQEEGMAKFKAWRAKRPLTQGERESQILGTGGVESPRAITPIETENTLASINAQIQAFPTEKKNTPEGVQEYNALLSTKRGQEATNQTTAGTFAGIGRAAAGLAAPVSETFSTAFDIAATPVKAVWNKSKDVIAEDIAKAEGTTKEEALKKVDSQVAAQVEPFAGDIAKWYGGLSEGQKYALEGAGGFLDASDAIFLGLAPAAKNSVMKFGKEAVVQSQKETAQKIASGALNVAKNVAAAPFKAAGTAYKGTADAVKFGIAKTYGLSRGTVDDMFSNPEMIRELERAGTTPSDLFESVLKDIGTQKQELKSTGKIYDEIRKSEGTFFTPNQEIQKLVKDSGVKIDFEGKLDFSKSPFASSADIMAIEDTYHDILGAASMNADELLNLRSRIDSRINWKSGTNTNAQRIVKQMRYLVDEVAKTKIKGLKEVDEKYAPLRRFINQIDKEVRNRDGTIKDNAISRIANLANKGNEFRLQRLEKLQPGIGEKVRALRSLNDIEVAAGNKVGSYAQNIIFGAGAAGSIATGTFIPVVIGAILSNPKVIKSIILNYAITRNIVSKAFSDFVDNIVRKISKGIKLNAKEAKVVSGAISNEAIAISKEKKALGTQKPEILQGTTQQTLPQSTQSPFEMTNTVNAETKSVSQIPKPLPERNIIPESTVSQKSSAQENIGYTIPEKTPNANSTPKESDNFLDTMPKYDAPLASTPKDPIQEKLDFLGATREEIEAQLPKGKTIEKYLDEAIAYMEKQRDEGLNDFLEFDEIENISKTFASFLNSKKGTITALFGKTGEKDIIQSLDFASIKEKIEKEVQNSGALSVKRERLLSLQKSLDKMENSAIESLSKLGLEDDIDSSGVWQKIVEKMDINPKKKAPKPSAPKPTPPQVKNFVIPEGKASAKSYKAGDTLTKKQIDEINMASGDGDYFPEIIQGDRTIKTFPKEQVEISLLKDGRDKIVQSKYDFYAAKSYDEIPPAIGVMKDGKVKIANGTHRAQVMIDKGEPVKVVLREETQKATKSVSEAEGALIEEAKKW